jgi:hypothetical protein
MDTKKAAKRWGDSVLTELLLEIQEFLVGIEQRTV